MNAAKVAVLSFYKGVPMPNIFTAQAPWAAICYLSRHLCSYRSQSVHERGENYPRDLRENLCYMRILYDAQDRMVAGVAQHVAVVDPIIWKGFSYGVNGIKWDCHIDATMELLLQDNGSYRILFIGHDGWGSESLDLLRFLEAVDLSTLEIRQFDWDKIVKLARYPTELAERAHYPRVNAWDISMLKRLGQEIVDKTLDPALKEVEAREKALD